MPSVHTNCVQEQAEHVRCNPIQRVVRWKGMRLNTWSFSAWLVMLAKNAPDSGREKKEGRKEGRKERKEERKKERKKELE